MPGVQRLDITDLPEIQSLDSKKVVAAKLEAARERVSDIDERIILVDDVSLTFDQSHGFPGPLVRWLIDSGGKDGGPRALYKYGTSTGSRRAFLSAHIGLCGAAIKNLLFFEGRLMGTFGPPCEHPEKDSKEIDRIFKPNGSHVYLGQMSWQERTEINHRAIALRKVRAYLEREVGYQFP